jgi:hypothetical protein
MVGGVGTGKTTFIN